MSQSCPMARHCMPQKQTHRIAITALHSAAPTRGGFGPDRCGRVPCLAMAVSSVRTASTKTSISANASHGPGDVLAGRTAVPIVCGLGAVDDECAMACRPTGPSPSIQPQVAIMPAPAGSCSLQTDTENGFAVQPTIIDAIETDDGALKVHARHSGDARHFGQSLP